VHEVVRDVVPGESRPDRLGAREVAVTPDAVATQPRGRAPGGGGHLVADRGQRADERTTDEPRGTDDQSSHGITEAR